MAAMRNDNRSGEKERMYEISRNAVTEKFIQFFRDFLPEKKTVPFCRVYVPGNRKLFSPFFGGYPSVHRWKRWLQAFICPWESSHTFNVPFVTYGITLWRVNKKWGRPKRIPKGEDSHALLPHMRCRMWKSSFLCSYVYLSIQGCGKNRWYISSQRGMNSPRIVSTTKSSLSLSLHLSSGEGAFLKPHISHGYHSKRRLNRLLRLPFVILNPIFFISFSLC